MTRLSTTLDQLVACVCEALTNDGAGEPCFCGLLPGDNTPWDFCGPEVTGCGDTCGMGYVRLQTGYPSTVFPIPDLEGQNCAKPLAFRVEVGALRCMPITERDELPTADDLADVAHTTILDMMALMKGIMCCEDADDRLLVQITEWVPMGPGGGCVGGHWIAHLSYD